MARMIGNDWDGERYTKRGWRREAGVGWRIGKWSVEEEGRWNSFPATVMAAAYGGGDGGGG